MVPDDDDFTMLTTLEKLRMKQHIAMNKNKIQKWTNNKIHCWDRFDMKSVKVLQIMTASLKENVFEILSINYNIIILLNITNYNRYFLFSEHASF